MYSGSLFLVGIPFLLEHVFSRRYLSPPRCCENTHRTASNHGTMAMACLMSLCLFLNLLFIQTIWCSNLPDHFLKVYWSPPFCTEPWSQQNFDCYAMFSVSCSIIAVAFTYKYWYFFPLFTRGKHALSAWCSPSACGTCHYISLKHL